MVARIGWGGRRTCGRRLRIGGGSRVLFNGGAEFVKSAGVLAVFGGDAFGNRLNAFKLSGRIKETALLAAVKFELAFGAGTIGIKARGEDGSAICATRASDCPDHAWGPRSELIGASRTSRGRMLGAGLFFFFVFFRVAIAAVAVLTIHKCLRPRRWADCHNNNLEFGAGAQ